MMSGKTGAALAVQALVMGLLLALALDQYAHKRVEQQGGVNVWGYRGPVARHKQDNEVRVVVAGGDQAFAWGVGSGETMAAYLRPLVEAAVQVPGEGPRWVTTQNIGALGLPARGYDERIRQYHGLAPDAIVVVVDLADSRQGPVMPPFDSAITALTGYVPMLPTVLQEKGRQLGGVTGAAAAAAGGLLRAVDAGAYHLVAPSPGIPEDRIVSTGTAVHTALGIARGVVVVLPIPRSPAEAAERDRLRDVIAARAAAQPRLALVGLSESSALQDDRLLLDGRAFGAQGQQLMAGAVAPAVVRVLNARDAS